MKLTHVEISVPDGTLTDPFARRLDRLLVDVFGWVGTTATVQHPELGPTRARTYTTSGPAVVLRQATVALQPGIEDHLGFAVDPDELERLVAGCVELTGHDGDVELRYVTDGQADGFDAGGMVHRTFFVRYLLPLWFQFESRKPVSAS